MGWDGEVFFLACGIQRLDTENARSALSFKAIMEHGSDATPAQSKVWPTNMYSHIAVALKCAELREVGLANLAKSLSTRIRRAPVAVPRPQLLQQRSPLGLP